MSYQAKPMPFDPKSISGISEMILVSHYENRRLSAGTTPPNFTNNTTEKPEERRT